MRQTTHVDDWDVVYVADRLGANSSNPIHPSHHLGEWRRVIVCWKCGKWAISKPRHLVKLCKEYRTEVGKSVIKRLQDNKPPVPKASFRADPVGRRPRRVILIDSARA